MLRAKTSLLCLLFSFWIQLSDSIPALASENSVIQGSLTATLSPWSTECDALEPNKEGSCSIPMPAAIKPLVVRVQLPQVSHPGQSERVTLPLAFSESEVRGQWTVYSIYPYVESGNPPYLQLRLELTEPVRALCLSSVKFIQAGPLPPLICVGYQVKDGETRQFGITAVPKIEPPSPLSLQSE